MSKPKNVSQNTISSYEANKKIRKDWNGINPVTKVIPNKKKDKNVKHKKKELEENLTDD